MISSIAGDIVGSRFEFNNKKSNAYTSLFADDSCFTDDTVLLVATADAILNKELYKDKYYEYAIRYPNRGYGKMFSEMIAKGSIEPYNSYGNGSAMRVAPVAWIFRTGDEILDEAQKTAQVTHDNPEGIKGAQFVAYAVWRCKGKEPKADIGKLLQDIFKYDLSLKTSEFERKFDVTCQGTIPRCWAIFNESHDFESAMRLGISMGGDVDTNCAIVGALCDAYYGLPSKDITQAVYERLPIEMSEVVTKFVKRYIDSSFEPPLFEPKPSTANSILDLGDLFEDV